MSVRDPLASFADIQAPSRETEPAADDAGDFYPGSKKKRRAVTGEPTDEWSLFPHYDKKQKGVMRRFYPVGVLAFKLERGAPAIRKWEKQGFIPYSLYRTVARNAHGQKRLYTREQIEGLVAIAKEEGLLAPDNRNVSATAFPERAAKLFKELK